jgi:lipopolysaccharide biosynthesis regulator YciM
VRWLRRAFARSAGRTAVAGDPIVAALRAALGHEWETAEALLSEVVRRDSGQVQVYLALAQLYRRRGELSRAIRIHQNLLLRSDLPPALRTEALLGLAEDFRRGGFLGRAVAAYREALDREPRDPRVLRALAGLYAESRDHAGALAMARRLARAEGRRQPADEARLLVELAQTARADGRSEDAHKALKRALRRDPASAAAWAELGDLEAERGRTKRALAAWQRVPALDRRAAEPLYPRIEATYAALGRTRDFEAWIRGLVSERPEDASARMALFRSLAARGDSDAALTEVGALLERAPDHLPAQVARARLLLDEGRAGDAAKALADLVASLDRLGLVQVRERME